MRYYILFQVKGCWAQTLTCVSFRSCPYLGAFNSVAMFVSCLPYLFWINSVVINEAISFHFWIVFTFFLAMPFIKSRLSGISFSQFRRTYVNLLLLTSLRLQLWGKLTNWQASRILFLLTNYYKLFFMICFRH